MATISISPSGGDDTSNIQNHLNSTASAGDTLQLNAGSYSSGGLTIPSNTKMNLLSGVTVRRSSGLHFLTFAGSSNVTITGAGPSVSGFDMGRGGADCFRVQNTSNVTLSGIFGNSAGEDGLYVRSASNVRVSNCKFDNNTRQGSSITGFVSHIFYNNCTFSNTNGHGPAAGIDIEPNQNTTPEFLTDINITDCTMLNNQGDGIDFSVQWLDGTAPPITIHVLRNTNIGNGGGPPGFGYGGYMANNSGTTNPGGYILVEDSTTTNDAYWGACGRFWAANGTALIFKNLTVTNPHRLGPDPSYGDSAAVATAGGGGNVPPIGNVHYINCNISVTNGKVDHYFNFNTNGGTGVTNVQFIPGTLSGASSSTMGLYRGSPSGPIN